MSALIPINALDTPSFHESRVVKETGRNAAETAPGPEQPSEGTARMSLNPDKGIAPADQAKAAFNEYADLVRLHANIPALWDEPDRVQARNAAHARFIEAFEAEQ